MCGIVGYVGRKQAAPILLQGLRRLSYRGYDSAGVAIAQESGVIEVRKAKGKLNMLENVLFEAPPRGCAGIGHTRWATHGEPNNQNAHPHTDGSGQIAVVHNGIIENHEKLRGLLTGENQKLIGDTDTEIVAHLLGELYEGNMIETLMRVASMLEGSYALGVMCEQEPGLLFCMRKDSSLVMGFRDGEGYIASDIPAVMEHTRDVIFLKDGEIGVVSRCGISVYDCVGNAQNVSPFHVDWEYSSTDRNGYAHFMLKEIFEQPDVLRNVLQSHAANTSSRWLPFSAQEAQSLRKLTIVACGTAYHAGVYGKYMLESLAKIPVEVDVASEYRYRLPVFTQNECVIVISQSGETADTLAALRYAKQSGVRVIAICNVASSTIAREADDQNVLYTYAGTEVAVASTKAYTAQATVLLMLAVSLASLRKTAQSTQLDQVSNGLSLLPSHAESALQCADQMRRLAARFKHVEHVFFIGRGADYAIALEAALKLKEVSYLFSEAYAAGELKHGPLALIERGRLVIAAVTQESLLEKSISNLREVLARGAELLLICPKRFLSRLEELPVHTLPIPDADGCLAPLIAMLPLQLFAYYMALERGCDIDQPRNLAKSVTVE